MKYYVNNYIRRLLYQKIIASNQFINRGITARFPMIGYTVLSYQAYKGTIQIYCFVPQWPVYTTASVFGSRWRKQTGDWLYCQNIAGWLILAREWAVSATGSRVNIRTEKHLQKHFRWERKVSLLIYEGCSEINFFCMARKLGKPNV